MGWFACQIDRPKFFPGGTRIVNRFEVGLNFFNPNEKGRRVKINACRPVREGLVSADGQDCEGVWHLRPGPSEDLRTPRSAGTAARVLGQTSGWQPRGQGPSTGCETRDARGN